jgi:hypothetical protein
VAGDGDSGERANSSEPCFEWRRLRATAALFVRAAAAPPALCVFSRVVFLPLALGPRRGSRFATLFRTPPVARDAPRPTPSAPLPPSLQDMRALGLDSECNNAVLESLDLSCSGCADNGDDANATVDDGGLSDLLAMQCVLSAACDATACALACAPRSFGSCSCCFVVSVCVGGTEGRRDGRTEGGREGGKEGGREGGMDGEAERG